MSLITCTYTQIPSSNKVLKEIDIPLAIIFSPFTDILSNKLSALSVESEIHYCSECGTINTSSINCTICTPSYSSNVLGSVYSIPLPKVSHSSTFVDSDYYRASSINTPLCIFVLESPNDLILDCIINNRDSFEYYCILIQSSAGVLALSTKKNYIYTSEFIPITYCINNTMINEELVESIRSTMHNIKYGFNDSLFSIISALGKNFKATRVIYASNTQNNISNINTVIESLNDYNITFDLIGPNKNILQIVRETNGMYYSKCTANTLHNILNTPTYYNIRVDIKSTDNLRRSSTYCDSIDSPSISIHMPSMRYDESIAVQFSIDEYIKHSGKVQVQVYYTEYNKYTALRKCIVMNTSLCASNNIKDIYKGINAESVFHLFMQHTNNNTVLHNKIINSIGVYYNYTKCNVIPSNIKRLCTLFLYYLKTPPTINNTHKLCTELLVRYYNPRLLRLSDYILYGTVDSTPTLDLSMGEIEEEEEYIVDNGESIYLLNEVSEEVLREINSSYNKKMDSVISKQSFIALMRDDPLRGFPCTKVYLDQIQKEVIRR